MMAVRPPVLKAPTARPCPPPVLHRRYAMESAVVGRGACATVYRSWDARLGRLVAVKRAHQEKRLTTLVRHEAEILADVQHQAIPALLDTFEQEGWWYLVEGWRAGRPPLPVLSALEVVQLGRQCCEVLAHLHARGIVHRDLKPEHLLVEQGKLTLLDLSIACRLDDPPLKAGSRAYAPPEQWREGSISTSADIYSLGMVLRFWLTNQDADALAWEELPLVSDEALPVLALCEEMIAPAPASRPDLAQVTGVLEHLERCLTSR